MHAERAVRHLGFSIPLKLSLAAAGPDGSHIKAVLSRKRDRSEKAETKRQGKRTTKYRIHKLSYERQLIFVPIGAGFRLISDYGANATRQSLRPITDILYSRNAARETTDLLHLPTTPCSLPDSLIQVESRKEIIDNLDWVPIGCVVQLSLQSPSALPMTMIPPSLKLS